MTGIHAVFESLLQQGNLDVLFQPILNIQERRILGFEALVRGPQGSPLESPNTLFEIASAAGRLNELETLCQQSVIERFSQAGLDSKLFMNVMPLGQDELTAPPSTRDMLNRYGIAPRQVVIELTRCRSGHDYQDLFNTFQHYASQGFEISVDAYAMGKASPLLWKQLLPGYLKLGRSLIRNIDSNPESQESVTMLRRQAERLHARLVAEGVETAAEVACLTQLGVEYLQGYYISKPSRQPNPELKGPSLLEALRAAQAG